MNLSPSFILSTNPSFWPRQSNYNTNICGTQTKHFEVHTHERGGGGGDEEQQKMDKCINNGRRPEWRFPNGNNRFDIMAMLSQIQIQKIDTILLI